MEKNFQITDSIYLKLNHSQYDIHNDYDFEKLTLDSEFNQLNVYLVKGTGDWIKKEDPSKIVILFEGLDHVSFSEGFFKEKSTTIEEFGYKSESDFDLQWLKAEEQSENGDHLIIRFENNEYLRIYSKRAKAVV
jgi:hypothetical protein